MTLNIKASSIVHKGRTSTIITVNSLSSIEAIVRTINISNSNNFRSNKFKYKVKALLCRNFQIQSLGKL